MSQGVEDTDLWASRHEAVVGQEERDAGADDRHHHQEGEAPDGRPGGVEEHHQHHQRRHSPKHTQDQ